MPKIQQKGKNGQYSVNLSENMMLHMGWKKGKNVLFNANRKTGVITIFGVEKDNDEN